ncbi:MAG: alpha/beta hydrolase [Rhodocyclaceae bacterium]|jgi:pimeloyl-ACP methyl ester carboxylesterase|nr:2-succinyl-6-hydroxy-2,4-cyclohexadiene-1-carboxylate synthase [Rhodocyclaceae bacterium]MBZ0142613.1 alpha/beta hydrolase [Rhodocyclaceae bacterium]MCC6878972.1 alpha/beta hydrolase [Rhodocyclaceae bacterium]MCL4681660.1 alpha/beta hydrolase [Rhodocyclaceae bacterium]
MMTSNYLTVLDRELHYTEWGAGNAETVVMWHGLARTGRDFDDIAAALSDRYRVLCPDTLGRGLSQWSPQPEEEYSVGFYTRLAVAFVDALGVGSMRWLGTSMGAMIGTAAAAGPLKGRITHLVLNDMGPKIGDAALARITAYAGSPAQFARVSELENYFRTIYKPFGLLTDAQWRRLAETSVRRLPDGKVTPHYDPKIVMMFTHHEAELEQWNLWDALECKALCLRGAESDLLLAETAADMARRGPRARVATFPGIGHAPALNVPEQIGLVAEFFAG